MSAPYLISNPNALARAGQAIGEFFVTTIPNAAKVALNATAAFFSKATIGNTPVWAWFVVGLCSAGVITIAILLKYLSFLFLQKALLVNL